MTGYAVQTAFIDVLSRAPDGPVGAWARMRENLANQKAGAQWRKNLIPKLGTWLRDGDRKSVV